MKSAGQSALNPVFAGLRFGLHALVIGLAAVVIAVALAGRVPGAAVIVCVAAVFAVTYAGGALFDHVRHGSRRIAVALWVAALSLEWLALVVVSPEAIYLVFPLSFLFLNLAPGWWGTSAVVIATAVAIVAFGLHRGFGFAGIVGPVVGAAVAVFISLGYRSLTREVQEREQLIAQLTATRQQLAAAERAAGVLDERGRLAREIHDTVSQSLSGIVMLLHAAEKDDTDRAVLEHRVVQARGAATEALSETRKFIDELAPPSLRTATIVSALGRLAAQTQVASGVEVRVKSSEPVGMLPATIETALFRVAQSALANVVQHARASRAEITLSVLENEVILDVVDNGVGFDRRKITRRRATSENTSFGLQAMADRIAQVGGSLIVESTPGHGTSIVASLEVTP